MDKKQIAKLVEMSFVDGVLDEHSVNKAIGQLDGRELREFLKILTEQEKRQQVYIDLTFAIKEGDKKIFRELFPGKRVVFRNDTDLVFGIRITDNDMVYNLNMKDALDQIKSNLRKN
jgi:hypothetical protein